MKSAAIALVAELSEIARMNAWIAEHWEGDDEAFHRLKLCLNEAVENVIRHGFDDTVSGRIRIRLDTRTDCAQFELRDNGRPFDPLEAIAPTKMRDIGTAQIGGFGIALMRDAATSLAYGRVDGQNVLTARFCRGDAAASYDGPT